MHINISFCRKNVSFYFVRNHSNEPTLLSSPHAINKESELLIQFCSKTINVGQPNDVLFELLLYSRIILQKLPVSVLKCFILDYVSPLLKTDHKWRIPEMVWQHLSFSISLLKTVSALLWSSGHLLKTSKLLREADGRREVGKTFIQGCLSL